MHRLFLPCLGCVLLLAGAGVGAATRLAHAASARSSRVAGGATYVNPAPNGGTPFPTCPAFGVIGSRGSGENDPKDDSSWGQGLSVPAMKFAQDFGALVPGVQYTSNPYPGYPASDAPGTTINTIYFHAYRRSEADGVDQLEKMVRNQHTRCGTKTKLILTGYSQGAQVSADVYMDLHGAAAGQTIFGAVLFADPRYNHVDPSDFRTDQQIANQTVLHHNGALSYLGLYYMGKARNFPTSSIGRVLSYCLINDDVCQGIGGNPISHQHSKYGTSTYPADAANWFAAQTAFATPYPISSVKEAECNGSGTLLEDVTFKDQNNVDVEPSYRPLTGHAWAYVNATVHRKIWQINDSTFCVYEVQKGTFTAVKGAKSPAGGTRLVAAARGSFEGGASYQVTGTYSGDPPLIGSQGPVDEGCTITASDGSYDCNPNQDWASPVDYSDSDATPIAAGEDWRFSSSSGDIYWWDGANKGLGDVIR